MDPEEITQEEELVEEPTAIEETDEGEKVENPTELKRAMVEYDYSAREEDELSLNKGNVVTLLEQNGEWWKCDLNGKIGMVPANHVKLIEESTEDSEDTENPEGVKKKTLNKYGVKPGGLGSLFSGGIPTLKKRSQPLPENSPVSEEKHVIASVPIKKASIPSPVNQQPPNTGPSPNLPPKKKPPKPKKTEAEVIFEYEADGDDEISLTVGSHVTIIEKVDEGWWSGKNEQGETGLFPCSYVKEIKQTEVQRSRSVSEETTVEEVERHESSEISATVTQEEVLTASVSADSIHSEVHSEDYSISPKSPPPKSPPPPTPPNRRSTHESSQAIRRSTHESTSPTSPRRNSNHGEEQVTSRRPPSLVSPDLPPIQSISTNFASVDTSPISERPIAQKSPTLAKPPKSFSPAKPPVVSPIKRSSSSASKSSKTKSENSPTEPVSPKINRRSSYDQYDSSTTLSEPSELENKEEIKEDDDAVEDDEQTEVVSEKLEVREEVDEEAEVSEEEKEVVTETLDTKEDDDTIGGHEVEPEEKKPQPQLPLLPSGPKLSNLQKDRPITKKTKPPSAKSVKESASNSQTSLLLEDVESAKDEVEQKSQPVTPPKPEKPEKPAKLFKLPTLGANVQLRSVPKKPSTESTETITSSNTSTTSTTSTSTTSSGIDTKPISGGVKGLSSRFNQFGGIPNSSDVEFRLKKWFNEEINKVKSNFEAKLAEERSKREALEEEFRELIASLQES